MRRQNIKPIRDNGTNTFLAMQKLLKDKMTPKSLSKKIPKHAANCHLVYLPGTSFESSYSLSFVLFYLKQIQFFNESYKISVSTCLCLFMLTCILCICDLFKYLLNKHLYKLSITKTFRNMGSMPNVFQVHMIWDKLGLIKLV